MTEIPDMPPKNIADLKSQNRGLFLRIWREAAQATPRLGFYAAIDRLIDAARAEGEAKARLVLIDTPRARLQVPAQLAGDLVECDTCHALHHKSLGACPVCLVDSKPDTPETATQVMERQRAWRGRPAVKVAGMTVHRSELVPQNMAVIRSADGQEAKIVNIGEPTGEELMEVAPFAAMARMTPEEWIQVWGRARPRVFSLEDIKAQAEPGETIEVERVKGIDADQLIISGAGPVSEARIRERMPLGMRVTFEPFED